MIGGVKSIKNERIWDIHLKDRVKCQEGTRSPENRDLFAVYIDL
jgi:hypothetical protein